MKILFLLILIFCSRVTSQDFLKYPVEDIDFKLTNEADRQSMIEQNKVKTFYILSALPRKIDHTSQSEVSTWLRTTTYERISDYLGSYNYVSRDIANQDKNWGYTFFKLSAFDVDILKKIAQLFDESRIRPKVLDLGCGYAFLAPLILAAGGHYKGVEHLKNIALEANREIWKHRTLWTMDGEVSKDLYKINPNSILSDNLRLEENFFDIIICKNVMHFYTPHENEIIISKIHGWLKSQGIAYILTDSPQEKKQLLDFYENNKESNCTYPGFGIRNEPTYFCAYCFNNIITRASSPNRCPPIITEETLMVNITGSPDLVPALFTPGFLQEDGTLTHNDMITKSKPIDIVRSDTGEAGKCVVITDWHHTIYNLFTAEQLGQLFEKHNFITLELLNIDFMGLKMPDGPQRLIDSKAGVVVKKP